jgi:hypothetical protein
MDILDIKPQTITIDLIHPKTNKPVGIKVELQSLESDAVKSVQRAIANKALRGGRNSTTAEKMEANSMAILAATIVSWEWADGLTLGDIKKPACTDENKQKLLSNPVWSAQIDRALGDESAFFSN